MFRGLPYIVAPLFSIIPNSFIYEIHAQSIATEVSLETVALFVVLSSNIKGFIKHTLGSNDIK